GDALHRGVIDTLVHHGRLHRRTRHDRLADQPVVPGLYGPRIVQADAHAVQKHGPVEPAPGVVLTRPDQLHRHRVALVTSRLGDRHRLHHVVGTRTCPAAEAATGIKLDQRYALGRNAEVLGHGGL